MSHRKSRSGQSLSDLVAWLVTVFIVVKFIVPWQFAQVGEMLQRLPQTLGQHAPEPALSEWTPSRGEP